MTLTRYTLYCILRFADKDVSDGLIGFIISSSKYIIVITVISVAGVTDNSNELKRDSAEWQIVAKIGS